MSLLRYALVTVPLVLLLGTLSGRASNSGYSNDWFAALEKPAAMPPAWVFPVAWTILYIMIGLALAIVLHARGARGRGVAVGVFVAQLLLNYSWSPLFFAMHETRAALVLILAMLVLAVAAAVLFGKIRRAAGLLMLPYLAWLAFAGYLNYAIVALNPGADTLVPGEASADIAL
jgi:tryptophan-rich sensory protein